MEREQEILLPDNWQERKEEIAEHLAEVKENIARACSESGRDPSEVNLIIVTKNHPWSDAYALWTLGERHFGENRVQELTAKMEDLAKAGASPHWHLIGSLQRNKVKYISGKLQMIHSVDSLRLAEMLQKQAEKRDIREEILLQVNYTGEESKHGFTPEGVKENLQAIEALPNIRLRGLMTMAEYDADEERIAETFSGVRQLRDELKGLLKPENQASFERLSMGMTHDYEIAVRCGATDLRIGSAILGERIYS